MTHVFWRKLPPHIMYSLNDDTGPTDLLTGVFYEMNLRFIIIVVVFIVNNGKKLQTSLQVKNEQLKAKNIGNNHISKQ